MRTPIKYLLFQVPGWILAVLLLAGLHVWIDLPVWAAIGLFSLWVLKDLVFYPLLKVAYESSEKVGVDQLIGLRGVATENLDPRGYVHVRGELWRAETGSGKGPISSGSPVKVVGVDGMTLIVDTEGGGATGTGGKP